MSSDVKIPELLAPAGSYDGLVSAVQSGADAVYLGLQEFSARKNAANFSLEELGRGLYYAHLHEVKVYLTLNTLVKDDELAYVCRLAEKADTLGVDAFILQDIGLISALRNNVGAQFHASTQMTVVNKEGASVLSRLGFTRVVPARELSLQEIKDLCDAGICETEVFCHGALCMSYSGQCMMSALDHGHGERSGNRGSCSQPCRLKYGISYSENGSVTSYPKGCRLSPADLCSLPYLDRLVGTGVSSLKIEGRLKRPEYAALVTRKYRLALDAIAAGKPLTDVSDDIYDLSTQFSRGGFSSGHQLGKLPLSSITFDSPGHSGAPCGKVLSNPVRLKSPVPLYSVNVSLTGMLRKGDSVFFGNRRYGDKVDSGSGNVNLINSENGRIEHASKGSTVSLTVSGNIGDIRKGFPVFRTQDGALTNELTKLYKLPDEHKKVPVSAFFEAHAGEKASLTLTDSLGIKATAYSASEVTVSGDSSSIDSGRVMSQVEKLGQTPFFLADFTASIDPGVFMPLSAINEMRRTAASELTELKGGGGRL